MKMAKKLTRAVYSSFDERKAKVNSRSINMYVTYILSRQQRALRRSANGRGIFSRLSSSGRDKSLDGDSVRSSAPKKTVTCIRANNKQKSCELSRDISRDIMQTIMHSEFN